MEIRNWINVQRATFNFERPTWINPLSVERWALRVREQHAKRSGDFSLAKPQRSQRETDLNVSSITRNTFKLPFQFFGTFADRRLHPRVDRFSHTRNRC